uniref:Uncharacterized protein n=1 Tax=Tanacetum cinerariifolium TaxID=118510 RepID=A0A699TL37_TANCI|nr:hypothetical protein [Tanacetum cinerariifolium]
MLTVTWLLKMVAGDSHFGGVAALVGLWWGWCSVVAVECRGSDIDERIDRETRNLFGFAEKIPPEKFSGGGRVVADGG